MQAIIRRLRREKGGLSTAIVVMLSLVLVVTIVGNVVLWSYQMNQFDMDRMHETITIANVTKAKDSLWYTAENEFAIEDGRHLSGTYADTRKNDSVIETFLEVLSTAVPSTFRLAINNTFTIDLSTCPIDCIRGIEMLLKYNVTNNEEKWFLKAYNWSASSFSDIGFSSTEGTQPALNEWNEYSILITSAWLDYVAGNGTILLQFLDEGLSTNQSIVEIDFLGTRAIIDGASFELKNSSPLSLHIISLWITNSTIHQRYEADFFMNSGESAVYVRADVELPQDDFSAKVLTERGNMAILSVG